MSEWQSVTVEEIASKIAMGPFGSDIKTDNFVDEGVPVIRGGNLTVGRFNAENFVYLTEEKANQLANANAFPDDIVFTHRGTLGQVGLLPSKPFKRYVVSQSQMKLTCNLALAHPAFVYYYFISPIGAQALLANTSQTGVPAISRPVSSLKSIRLRLPPLHEQRAIATVFTAIDDKIDLNRRMNETLEQTARAIFKDWFVEFGPTRAKMAGQEPYLSADLWALFPERLDEAGMPEGWERDQLGRHVQNFDSKRVPVSGAERRKRQGPYPYHGAAGIMDYVDGYLFDDIFVLIGEDGSVKTGTGHAVTQYVWGKIWVNNHAHVLKGKGAVSTEQLLCFFAFEPVEPYVTGAVQPKLSQGRMNSMPFIFAGEHICKAFTDYVVSLFEKLRANSEESRTLAQTRDLLLPRLMSGELRVQDAEAQVAEVL